jgi:hypothetical protein
MRITSLWVEMGNPDCYQPERGRLWTSKRAVGEHGHDRDEFGRRERHRNKENSNGGLVSSFVIASLTVSDEIWEVC